MSIGKISKGKSKSDFAKGQVIIATGIDIGKGKASSRSVHFLDSHSKLLLLAIRILYFF